MSKPIITPAPRLEFQWREATPEEVEESYITFGSRFACDYGIVLPVSPNDCRSTFYDEKNDVQHYGLKTEVFYKFSTTIQNSVKPPRDDEKPFRDGAHAKWDSERLGGLEIWIRGYFGSHQKAGE